MSPEITLDLVRRFPSNGPTDPIRYYHRPLTGWLFRERVNMGLRMLSGRRFARGLEVGFGSGAVLAALSAVVDELHGIDLDADPELASSTLRALGVRASLRAGSVYELPYGDGEFDLAVSFSVFEHLHRYELALDEVRRTLKPGGTFLLGMPAVNLAMEAGFALIGFRGINHHHVTTPQQVEKRFAAHGFAVRDSATLRLPLPSSPDFPLPLPRSTPGLPVYFVWSLERA
ncbi:MAG: class I SAM-dependent methyltransferase [Polyangiales bacterium]